jgi:hypothetical protein
MAEFGFNSYLGSRRALKAKDNTIQRICLQSSGLSNSGTKRIHERPHPQSQKPVAAIDTLFALFNRKDPALASGQNAGPATLYQGTHFPIRWTLVTIVAVREQKTCFWEENG